MSYDGTTDTRIINVSLEDILERVRESGRVAIFKRTAHERERFLPDFVLDFDTLEW